MFFSISVYSSGRNACILMKNCLVSMGEHNLINNGQAFKDGLTFGVFIWDLACKIFGPVRSWLKLSCFKSLLLVSGLHG